MPTGGQIPGQSPGLRLQANTPGVQDTGNANVSGVIYATSFRTHLPGGAAPTSTVQIGTQNPGNGSTINNNTQSVLIGEGQQLGGLAGNIVIGPSANSGDGLTSSAQNSILIGYQVTWVGGYGTGQNSTIIGTQAQGGHGNQTIIGGAAQGGTFQGVTVIGASATAGAQFNISIGYGCTTPNANSINIGGSTPPAANGITIGTPTMTAVKIGKYDLSQPTSVLFSQTANATAANTAAETSLSTSGLGTRTIPANYLRAGSVVRVQAAGVIADTGAPTIQFRLKIGATTYLDFGAGTLGAFIGTHGWTFDGMVTIRTAGAGGTALGNGLVYVSTAGNPDIDTTNTVPVAIDTTAALAVDFTVQWGTANPANTITCTNLQIYIDA